MFVGREKELKALESFYAKEGIGMTVIFGRRRIGKSTLINEFVKNKKTIFYTASKVGKERNTELFGKQVLSELSPELGDVKFESLEGALDFITAKVGKEKVILVIDELPFWAEKDESLLSVLQKYIDTSWRDSNIKIILCGSSLSFMENKVLSEKSPLFGRRDCQIKLEAFSYLDSAKFVPYYSYEEKAICYGITGGVPKYLSLINPKLSLEENIIDLFFTTSGYLYDETRNLLIQEFSDVSLVNNIIEQIANGENAINDIATKLRERETTVLYSLEKLMQVGLVEKRRCMGEENNKKKTQYVLKDSMFKFWYQFIPKAVSAIEMDQGRLYYQKIVKPQLHTYMGSVFEDMCRYYALKKGILGEWSPFINEVGSWWGTERIEKDGKKINQSSDIDVVAFSSSEKKYLVGECKFKNEKIDRDVYETLVRRSALVPTKYQRVGPFLLFSLSGFTPWVEENAQDAKLITLEDMYA